MMTHMSCMIDLLELSANTVMVSQDLSFGAFHLSFADLEAKWNSGVGMAAVGSIATAASLL